MSQDVNLDDYSWLVSSAAADWLNHADDSDVPLHQRLTHLRKSLSPAKAHLVIKQVDLRQRGRAKFGAVAANLFFTPIGLEQATDRWVADYKSKRFASASRVADLCCGIGGDLLSLAARGPTIGMDRDAATVTFAAANLQVLSPPGKHQCRVQVADVESLDVGEHDAWHIDPDRRAHNRRTVDIDHMSPDAACLRRMLQVNPNAAIKLGPATAIEPTWQDEAELEWISRGGQCRQLVVWHGRLARLVGQRRATVLSNTGQVRTQLTGMPAPLPSPAKEIGLYVVELDAAVLAAGLAGTLARSLAIAPLATDIPYFTSDTPRADSAAAMFLVESVLPFDEKKIAAEAKRMGLGTLEIKHRGVSVQPEILRKNLRLRGDKSAVLILSPHQGRTLAIFAHRCN